MEETLDIAYTLAVEEFSSPDGQTLASGKSRVDRLLMDPETRARLDDQDAMKRLSAAGRARAPQGRRR